MLKSALEVQDCKVRARDRRDDAERLYPLKPSVLVSRDWTIVLQFSPIQDRFACIEYRQGRRLNLQIFKQCRAGHGTSCWCCKVDDLSVG